MCDYSLGGLPNRLAVEGEELVVHKFPSGSIGLASANDVSFSKPTPALQPPSMWARIQEFLVELCRERPCPAAVCVPPGARLIMKSIPRDLQREWFVGEEEEVRFMQRSAEVNHYRDCVRFSNQLYVLLQELREGMQVQVVCLGGSEAEDRHDLFDLVSQPERG